MNKKNILVFGGSKGIGRVFAQKMIEENNVYVFSRTWKKRYSKEPLFIKTDFLDIKNTKKEVLQLIEHIKKVDSIVFSQKYRNKSENFMEEFTVSVEIVVEIIGLLKDYMRKNSSIVIITSNAAKQIATDQSLGYHISKAALEQLVRYYAVKLAPDIRINAVAPAITLKPENIEFYNNEKKTKQLFSNIIPLQRMCKAEDVVNVIEFLLNEKSAFITGQVISVDGGLSLLTPEILLKGK